MHLHVQSPYELQLSVLGNRLDLAIGAFQLRMNGLIYHSLYREQHWLYCSDSHPLFNERQIPQETISQQRMVGRAYWSQTELARHGFKRSEATVDSMEGQLILILSGAFIGFLPEHYAQAWVDKGRLRALAPAAFGYQAPFAVDRQAGAFEGTFDSEIPRYVEGASRALRAGRRNPIRLAETFSGAWLR